MQNETKKKLHTTTPTPLLKQHGRVRNEREKNVCFFQILFYFSLSQEKKKQKPFHSYLKSIHKEQNKNKPRWTIKRSYKAKFYMQPHTAADKVNRRLETDRQKKNK